MSAIVETLEHRQFLSASSIHAQLGATPRFVARDQDVLTITATHDPAVVISNVATIKWGDGSPTDSVPVFPNDPATVAVNTHHTYAKPGTYTARLTFYQGDKVAGQVTRSIRVTPLSPGGVVLHARTGQALTALYGTFHTTLGVFGAVVDFGDGTVGPGVVTQIDDTTYQVAASHTYTRPGSYSVHISGNMHFWPPGNHIAIADGPFVNLFSSVRVTGRAVAPVIPQVQFTRLLPATMIVPAFPTGPAPEIATATGIPNEPYQQVYATIDWDSGVGDLAQISFNSDGSAVISGFVPSAATSTTETFTLKVFIHDHTDQSQNTLIGTLSGTVQIEPEGP